MNFVIDNERQLFELSGKITDYLNLNHGGDREFDSLTGFVAAHVIEGVTEFSEKILFDYDCDSWREEMQTTILFTTLSHFIVMWDMERFGVVQRTADGWTYT